jgi:hypothetical protein
LCISLDVQAGPLITTESPIGFFTNVATRLLQSQLGISLNHIQLYPTNQYTPSVHRLLQVTANVYDAITNRPITSYPYLPSVFRPVFAQQSGRLGYQIYISGFEEVTNTSILSASQRMVDLNDPSVLGHLRSDDMIWGIPLVIGAKKGFPNFNEFAMQTTVQISRKLEFLRQGGSDTAAIYQTNQMYVLSISNVCGIEAWNSYSNTYPRDLSISVIAENMNVYLTDAQRGQSWLYYRSFSANQTIAANTWTGFYDPNYAAPSFQYPLWTNFMTLTNSQYLQNTVPPMLVPVLGLGNTFERPSGLQSPDWWLTFTNRLQFTIVDVEAGRIVDYVNLEAGGAPLHITGLMGGWGCSGLPIYTFSANFLDQWCTNTGSGVVPYGLLNQIGMCIGKQPGNSWANDPNNWAACDFFRAQFPALSALHFPGRFTTTNTFYAPYVPSFATNFYTIWQANDPLVHYTIPDLTGPVSSANPMAGFGRGLLNDRYHPWGGNPYKSESTTTKWNLALKDPVIPVNKVCGSSDDWDFPTNPLSNLTWLGRVHRGTPWQTVYLKAPSTDLPTWVQWTGNTQYVAGWKGTSGLSPDAFFTQPTNDWRLASLLVSLLSTNDPRNLASVNQPSVPAWCGLLDGMTVLTNNLTDGQLYGQYEPPQFASLIMSSDSPQAATIATALVAARSSQPGQRIHDVGDILATPELSTASPWLNLSSAVQAQWGMTDEAYEAIPSQLLPLLRPDSIGAVSQSGGTLQVQFTGLDGYAYVVQTSSNLSDWINVSTNYPVNGSFDFVDTPPPGSPRRFYRSVLWP